MSRVLTLAVLSLVLVACQRTEQAAEGEQGAAAAEEPMAMGGPAPGTPEWKMESAMSAAPASIGANATIMDWPASEGAAMTELRKGTNGWMCMPDHPSTKGDPDPMCLDASWQNWADAWMNKKKPTFKSVGIGYMVAGGGEGSNVDPYATAATPENQWGQGPPHVMVIVPDAKSLEGMTTDPASGGPWVMWKGTDYVHVMVPLEKKM
ncbi:MAG: hypothetical protein HY561_01925 [Gemmatimonadetes bacterium]|nr:hypothetical protein [Gemmatimonadota bacterium]